MSFFVSRTVRGTACHADVFARGEVAVLCVASGEAAESLLDDVRARVLEPAFALVETAGWETLLAAHRSRGAVAVLAPGALVHASTGGGQAWFVTDTVTKLDDTYVGGELVGRLVVATDALFRGVADEAIAAAVRANRFWAVGDALVALTRGEDGVAVLVAER